MATFIPAYQSLYQKVGSLHWWPAQTPFEVIVGAILTQNTSWKNVEKALSRLRVEGYLSDPKAMADLPIDRLALMIRSSGYYNQKARKLKIFLSWFAGYSFSLPKVLGQFEKATFDELRNTLLGIHGIGPETADSILCYAFSLPYFVVDSYTIRWANRYIPQQNSLSDNSSSDNSSPYSSSSYEVLRSLVEHEFQNYYPKSQLNRHYNEFHAQLVHLGAKICTKRNPSCGDCSLQKNCAKNLV